MWETKDGLYMPPVRGHRKTKKGKKNSKEYSAILKCYTLSSTTIAMFLHLQITQRHTPFSADTNTFSHFQKLGLKWQRNSSLKITDSVSFFWAYFRSPVGFRWTKPLSTYEYMSCTVAFFPSLFIISISISFSAQKLKYMYIDVYSSVVNYIIYERYYTHI